MKVKPLYLLNVILTVVLLTSLLANAAIDRSETATKEYDPWKDMNLDGKINILDLVILAGYFGTEGTPINTTDLLLKLQARVDSLNASLIEHQARINILNASNIELQSRINSLNALLLDLEAYLTTRITTLETSAVELQSRIDKLNTSLIELQSQINNLYEATFKAHCIAENTDVSVDIIKDGLSSGDTTPHNFILTGSHTLTVPSADPNNHIFKQWNTGSTNTTIMVTSAGEYIAYYEIGSLNVSETIVTSGDFGIYTERTGGIEVSSIDWSPIAQGETKSMILYLRNKSLPLTKVWVSWTTESPLPSYLRLSMEWGPPTPWPENTRKDWNTWEVYVLKFTLTADSTAPLGSMSFNQLFQVHSSP